MSSPAEPKWLLLEAVLAMHKLLITEHGGASEVRDRSLLESALARPHNLFGYEDPKPSLSRLAASYAFGIAKNHPFVDGNKRVALTAAAVFLELTVPRLKQTRRKPSPSSAIWQAGPSTKMN